MTSRMPKTTAGQMSLSDLDLDAVLAPAWAAVREHHPELPACKFELSESGDFWASTHIPGSLSWEEILPGVGNVKRWWEELTIQFSISCLQLGIPEAFCILLHEACHVLDWARHGEISGHGEQFAAAATELRLTVKRNTAADMPPPAEPLPSWRTLADEQESFLQGHEHEVSLNDVLRSRYADAARGLRSALEPWGAAIAAWKPLTADEIDETTVGSQ